jgi:hypothetical protein
VLPKFADITLKKFAGPLVESNKVFDGLYAGAFPGDDNDKLNNNNLIKLLNAGITMFVCLQDEYKPNATEGQWRIWGYSVRPYYNDIQEILMNRKKYPTLKEYVPNNIKFEHYPIKDLKTISDTATIKVARNVLESLKKGNMIYLHCWGGHGRTGIIVCIVLHLMFGLTAEAAIEYCEFVHDKRIAKLNVRSPQTEEQRSQVRRIIASLQ